jgi:diguanylate cyclase (GGDEF)-like protein
MRRGAPDRLLSPESAGAPATAPERAARQHPAPGLASREWWLQGTIAAAVISFAVSTLVVHRPPSGYNTIWDGWVYNIAQMLPVIPVLMRVRRSPELRSAWLAMAIGMTLITVGDLVYTYHDQNLKPIPEPAPCDAVYLLAYATLIVGVALLTQSSFGRVHISIRLDGAIAGLAIGALVGMIWFGPLLHASGRPLEMVVYLAYPSCDLALIVLLAAGLAPHRYRPNWSTVLLMTGVLWFVVGDVITLNRVADNTYMSGTLLDTTWPIGLFFVGLAASMRDRRRSGGPRLPVSSPGGITVVPVMFAAVSLAVLVASLARHDSPVVPAMAIAALALVIARMWMTVGEVRLSVANYQDARTDYLTGLPNRRAFLERLEAVCSSAQSRNVDAGVLLVDLKDFKEINDALGPSAGDDLLCVVAKRFEHRLGERGIVARVGGDEYAFACPGHCEEDLVAIGHEIHGVLSDPCVVDGTSVRMGTSIGVAVSLPEGSSAEELLRRADVARYEAKHTQSAVSVYRAEIDPSSRDSLVLLDALRNAIDSRTLVLHYQPTVNMRTGAVYGVEALVRWQHPTRGLLYPDRFIPLAERNGLMPQLTHAVLDLAVAQAAQLDRAGQRLNMSVNISRYDLVNDDLPDYVDNLLAIYGFPHSRLTLEITESALGGDADRVEDCVRRLRARGLRISIDDFGVGYSSISQLLRLALDELKIDQSFVFRLTSDPHAKAIVAAVIEVARSLEITTVAEGIEDEEVFRLLRAMGADIGQGYVIARPLTAQRLDEFLAQPDRVCPGALAEPLSVGT